MPLFSCKISHLRKIYPKNCFAHYLVLLGENIINKIIEMTLSTDRMKKNAINRDSAKAKTVWEYVDNFTIKSLFSNFLP